MADIHHLITIAAPPVVVYGLVSTADGLRDWWAEDVETADDGAVSLGFFNRTTVYRLRSLDQQADRVAWHCETGKEWEGTDLIFTIRPQDAGVLLDFTHANWREPTAYFTSCNTTWGVLMFRIKGAAEGRNPGPLFQRNSLGY
jgi:uncharacterized protein YndB with AHSA1/START domain